MRIFLIHGMGRTPLSMWVLKKRLESAGYRTALFGYVVTVSDLDKIADRFVARVREVMSAESVEGSAPAPYAIVGHSLGNIVARLASPRLPDGFRSFAMLAPPNRSPAIVRSLSDNPLFKAATRDAGQKLGDENFYDALPMPEVPALVIAGTRGPRASWLPFGGAPNDSILTVEETTLEGIPTLEVPGVHTFLMNRRDVFQALSGFLEGEIPARDKIASSPVAS